jgi:phosphatidate cytidylyltransferase
LKNLIIRTITGAFYVAAIITSAIWSPLAFAILFLLMAVLGMMEFQRLLSANKRVNSTLPGLLAGLLIYSLVALHAMACIEAGMLWLIFPLITILAGIHLFTDKEAAIRHLAIDISGIVMVVLPLALLNLLLDPWMIPGYHTPWFVLGMFVILWTHDTFAYLTGSMFGKHPLYKSISPKKSWEGSIGGFGFAIIAAYIISVFSPELQLWQWMVIVLIVAVFGTIGDLAESLLKRSANVKDSGKLLPGHGGILDRVDSVLFIAPMVFVFILLCCL